MHRNRALHAVHGRRQVRQRRLPASASDPRVDRQPVAHRGTVLFKLPRSDDFVHLDGSAQVPIGTEVDTTDGVAKLTVARGVTLDTSEFYDGMFTVLQPSPKALGELRLEGGNFLDCVSSFRALAKKRPMRRLWGSGKGHFRTRGRYSSATVRGTKWLTEDLCGATRITVVQGTVLVHDFVRNVDVSVPAGHSYRANALPRSVRNAGCTIVGTEPARLPARDSREGRDLRAAAATTSSSAWAATTG